MSQTIILDDYIEEMRELQKAHFEIRCRENIIKYLIMQDQQNTPQYKKFWAEYLEYTLKYESAKEKFANSCVFKIAGQNFKGNWYVDFEKKELTIEYENKNN